MKGFVLSGNRLLRNIEVTIEKQCTHIERVLRCLDWMYRKEENGERRTEIEIVMQVLRDTFEDVQGSRQEGNYKLVDAFKAFREVLKCQQYLPEQKVVEKGLALAEYAIEDIIRTESKFLKGIVSELDSLGCVGEGVGTLR